MRARIGYIVMLSLMVPAINCFAQEGPPPAPQDGEAPPFVTVCKTLNAGDSCSYTDRDNKTVSGTCLSMKNPRTDKNELICSDGKMPGPAGPPPKNKN